MRTFWILQGKSIMGEKKRQGFYFEHGRADWPLWSGQQAGPEAWQPWEPSGAFGLPGPWERLCLTDPGSRNAFTGAKSTLCIGELSKFFFE